MNKKLLVYAVIVYFLFISCNKEEPRPAYIYVSDMEIIAASNFGSSSNNISDVWCIQNDNVQGVYELPVRFPIIAEGPTTLIFQAGIKMNGVSTTRISYPFYNNYEITLDLQPGETDTVKPIINYVSSVNVAFIENFDNSNSFSQMQRTATVSEIFEGLGSGKLEVAPNDSFVRAGSNRFNIPLRRAAVFLELDYKNTHDFTVGIRSYNSSVSGGGTTISNKLVITPKNEWNKIYVNITGEVNELQATEFDLIFTYQGNSNEQPEILFDNIKVLHQ